MTDTIITTQTPNQPVDSGGVVNRSVGTVWRTNAANKRISSGRYWVPAEGIGAGTLFQIWRSGIAHVSFDINTMLPAPTLNAFNTVPFPAPYDPVDNVDYIVCAALDGASFYRFSTGQAYPIGPGGPNGSVSASTAIFGENMPAIGSDPPNNAGFVGGLYFVDVNVDDIPAPPSGGGAFKSLFVATMCD